MFNLVISALYVCLLAIPTTFFADYYITSGVLSVVFIIAVKLVKEWIDDQD